MPTPSIDALIWKALTDTCFCEVVLTGDRRGALALLDLTEGERRAVMAVQADTLEAFAEALCRIRESNVSVVDDGATFLEAES